MVARPQGCLEMMVLLPQAAYLPPVVYAIYTGRLMA